MRPRSDNSSPRLVIHEKIEMSIKPEFLEMLRCPVCKSKVELKADGNALKCVGCHRVYPIRDDIPVMIRDEAVIEEEGKQS